MRKIAFIAKVCYSALLEYDKTIDFGLQKDWNQSPAWQQEDFFRMVNFVLNNPKCSPDDIHEHWLENKRIEGWKKGKEIDEKEKAHPNLTPFSMIPKDQKRKYAVLLGIIKEMKDM